MIRSTLNTLVFGLAMTVALCAGTVSVQAQDAHEKTQSTVHVGTYDVEAAFQQHPAQKELEKVSQTAQTQMQAAQQEGDRQKMQQIQQEFEASRGRIIETFYEDVNSAMPAAAKAADVIIVATEVSYAADDVETRDITSELIAAFDTPQEEPPAEVSNDDYAGLEVGTWDAQAVFQQHPSQKELNRAQQTAQAEMQAAQQEGDQQKLQQIQQKFEQTRGQVVETFYRDVNSAMPAVAKNADVKIVATEVTYTANDVKTKDITPQLIQSL